MARHHLTVHNDIEPSTPVTRSTRTTRSRGTKGATPAEVVSADPGTYNRLPNKDRLIHFYLVLYNVLAMALCLIVALCLTKVILVDPLMAAVQGTGPLSPGGTSVFFECKTYHGLFEHLSKGYDVVGRYLGYIQALTFLEIVHVALGWTPSSIMANCVQVLGRNFVIWIIVIFYGTKNVQSHPAFVLMTYTWIVADMIRYAYYAVHLSRASVPYLLAWARYSLFYILYPLGFGAEVMLIHTFASTFPRIPYSIHTALVLIMFSYFPAFHVMYGHMIARRAKALPSLKTPSSKSKKSSRLD